ncbi:hypothetical protein V2J92_21960 [Pseudomonas alliivorans]|nr:hypothetical protein [Pseudomonas alliivorans]MEE5171596.1 hypothetical protein [Pseudomonas alliivorans]
MNGVNLRIEAQMSPVTEEVAALTAVIRPILQGLLFALKRDVVEQAGGIQGLPLFMLPRVYRPGAGDCGICFEYAVHDAITRKDPLVVERVHDSLTKFCGVPGSDTASILFGAEKTGALQIIGSPGHLLTDHSRVLSGSRAQPAKLKQYIQDLTDAFRRQKVREQLPSSIAGLWKADLFLGNRDSDRWVGTTVKINRAHLEGAPGLRIGIVPAQYGRGDGIKMDDGKNLVVCPLPYDAAFMEIFYSAWVIVQSFLHADAKVPAPAFLPLGSHRIVAQLLEQRREFSVLEVVDSMGPIAQPGLLQTHSTHAPTEVETQTAADVVDTIIAPQPLQTL